MRDTPKTDAFKKEWPDHRRHNWPCSFESEAFAKIEEIERERNDLQRWKDEALAVESWWKKIDDTVRAHPDAIIGQVVADTALRFIRERDEFRDAIKDHDECADAWNRKAREMKEQRDALAALLREANDYVHECPLKARIRMALSATKGGKP